MTYDAAVMTGTGEGLWLRRAGQSEFERVSLLPRESLRGNRRSLVDLSPDGRTAVVEVRHGVLALIDLPDGEAVPLAHPPGNCHTASFSPDGSLLAVQYTNEQGVGVAVRSVADGSDRTVWFDPGAGHSNESAIAWDPDGTTLAITWFGHDDEEDCSTVVVGLDGQQRDDPRPATHLFPTNRSAWNREGLFVLDMDAAGYLALAEQPLPEETRNWSLITRSTGGLRVVRDEDPAKPHACLVINAAGLIAKPPVTLPAGERVNGMRVSDLFDS